MVTGISCKKGSSNSKPSLPASATPINAGRNSRFVENERVLCYEPDPTKVRVIYEAKILQIALVPVEGAAASVAEPTPSKKSRKSGAPETQQQFLVHFQGWNASWDRFVPESYLLKDTPENRLIQKGLVAEAEALRKSAKKNRKNKKRLYPLPDDSTTTATESTAESTDNEQTDSDSATTTTTTPASAVPLPLPVAPPAAKTPRVAAAAAAKLPAAASSESADFTSEIPVRLTDGLKRQLEEDQARSMKSCRVTSSFSVTSPDCPNAVAVLEDYVRHYANAQLLAYEKHRSKTFYTAYRKDNKQYFDKALDSISLAKEVAEGLRIMLDFYLHKHLLYDSEVQPFQEAVDKAKERTKQQLQQQKTKADEDKKASLRDRRSKASKADAPAAAAASATATLTPAAAVATAAALADPTILPESSRDSVMSGNSSVQLPSLLTPPGSTPHTPQSIQVLRSVQDWRLLPVGGGGGEFSHLPCVLCGPIYLLRLFVRLPEILTKMKMPQKTSKLIVKYMDSILEYFDSHQDLFLAKN